MSEEGAPVRRRVRVVFDRTTRHSAEVWLNPDEEVEKLDAERLHGLLWDWQFGTPVLAVEVPEIEILLVDVVMEGEVRPGEDPLPASLPAKKAQGLSGLALSYLDETAPAMRGPRWNPYDEPLTRAPRITDDTPLPPTAADDNDDLPF